VEFFTLSSRLYWCGLSRKPKGCPLWSHNSMRQAFVSLLLCMNWRASSSSSRSLMARCILTPRYLTTLCHSCLVILSASATAVTIS